MSGSGKPDFAQELRVKTESRGVMFPNAVGEARVGPARDKSGNLAALKRGNIDDFKNRAVTIYVFGRVTYKDVFDRKHWATFCYILDAATLDSFTLCDEHNETDDEPKKTGSRQ